MPTYQYACTMCGHQLEAVQSFSDAPLTVCPECDGRLRKVFSAVGVVFKGSGFYRTDSRSGASVNDGAAKSEATSSPASSGSGTEAAKGGGAAASGNGSSGSSSSTSSSTSGSANGGSKSAAPVSS